MKNRSDFRTKHQRSFLDKTKYGVQSIQGVGLENMGFSVGLSRELFWVG